MVPSHSVTAKIAFAINKHNRQLGFFKGQCIYWPNPQQKGKKNYVTKWVMLSGWGNFLVFSSMQLPSAEVCVAKLSSLTMWKKLFCFKRDAFPHASKSPFRASFLFMLTMSSHACKDLFFFTTKKEQPGTKVNERGHPGSISCQQSLQLFSPQKALWACINCQAKLREFSEFSWERVK